jgi:hypothetical protein
MAEMRKALWAMSLPDALVYCNTQSTFVVALCFPERRVLKKKKWSDFRPITSVLKLNFVSIVSMTLICESSWLRVYKFVKKT